MLQNILALSGKLGLDQVKHVTFASSTNKLVIEDQSTEYTVFVERRKQPRSELSLSSVNDDLTEEEDNTIANWDQLLGIEQQETQRR
jgi:hypothetical protein